MDINKFKKEKKEIKPKLTLTPNEENKDDVSVGIETEETKDITLDNTVSDFNNDETNLSDEDIKNYLTYFETLGITKTKVLEILDTILTTGDVNWSFSLLNKIPVVFRLRPSWVNDELLSYLDLNPPKTIVGFTEVIGRYNLAGSLRTYNNIKMDIQNEEELDNTLLFISKLPYILKSHLIKELSIFDRLISVATSKWALENFSSPQQEN
jgi:hypothetical protein